MTALEQLGAFVATCAPDERVRAKVRLHVADTVGAWTAATGTDEGRLLLAARTPDAAPADRLAIHCALARLSEVDDIHLGSMITPGAIVVPAALTLAGSLPGADANELAAAIVAGYEAMIRLGAAIDGPTVLYRGIWPTYFAAPFGVAAVAARLLRLDRDKTAHALSIALIAASPGTGRHAATSTVRWLAIGQAAARGLQAALAARDGFTSDLKLAEGDFLKNIYAVASDVGLLGEGWGEPALGDVSFKPWCAARQTMAATQALKDIMAEGIPAESIARIGVAVLPPHLNMIDHGVTPGDRFSYLTSVTYQMARAALMPDTACDLSAPGGPLPPAVTAFMTRIKVRAEESLLGAGYPQAWAAHVTVTTTSRRHQRTVQYVPGDPARPLGEDEVRAKFVRVVAPVLDSERANSLFGAAFDAIERPAEMIEMLAGIAAGQAGQNP